MQLLEKSQKSDVPPIRLQTSVPVRHQYIFVDFQRTSCYNIATTPATHYANSYYSAADTGLYYLQTRYYDPAIGRFINADAYTSTGQGILGNNMFAYCNNNPIMGCDPCGTCLHRWDFWNDCEECANKTLGDYFNEAVDVLVHSAVDALLGSSATILRALHYNRNLMNTTYTKEELDKMGAVPLGPKDDKFHQNNQKGGRNSKYVIGDWFSSEVVLYGDDTINNTPEDMGTFNVYFGNNPVGNIVIHGYCDVIPYMIWGNSPDDSTTLIDRILMGMG